MADALGNLVRWAVTGQPAPMITACLTGRPHHLTSAGGDAAPSLPAWL